MALYRRFRIVISSVVVLCTSLLEAASLVRDSARSSDSRQAVVADLLASSSTNKLVHTALLAERVRLKSEAPGAIQGSLANIALPLPQAVRELAKKAAASQMVTPEQARNSTQQLNEMIQEQHHLLDLKVLDCRERRRGVGEAIQDEAKDVRNLASETSAARSVIMESSSRIPQDKRAFEELKVEAQISRSHCHSNGQSDKVKATSLQRDAAFIASLQAALSRQCAGKVSLTQLPADDENDVVADAEKSLREVHMLNNHAIDFPEPEVVQAKETVRHKNDVRASAEGTLHSGTSVFVRRKLAHEEKTCSEMAAGLGVVAMKRGGHASAAFLQELQPLQCELNQHNCAAMLDVAAEVAGEIADSQARLRASSARARQMCKSEDTWARTQLMMETNQASDRSRELGEATWKAGEAGDRANEKDSHRQKLQGDLKTITAKCTADIKDILYGKICAMQKVRDSLQILAGMKELPEDCQVSDWDEGVCSATCGGGIKELTRQVILSQNGGAACPALKMQVQCGQTACPKDCEVSRWSGWSACSARCDGGVQERNRAVTSKPVGNGVACPHLVDMRLCNTEACSSSCKLLEWSSWSSCSKACGGGNQVRSRGLKDESKSGCPTNDSQDRLQLEPCNQQQCDDSQVAKCTGSKMDVVLLLDASGSMTASGFASLKALSLELANRYSLSEDGTKLSVATFAKHAKAISGLSADANELASKISSNAQWLQGPGNGGTALTRATSLLANAGRKDAQSLVLVVTDGRLVDPFLARQAAQKLKESAGARLAFALIGNDFRNLDLFKHMASQPSDDNIIHLPALDEIAGNIKLAANSIVTGTCSAVV